MFEPINKAHAIVEMMIFFELGQNDRHKIENLISASQNLSDYFPEEEKIQGYEFELDLKGEKSPSFSPVPGVERKRFRNNNNLEWLLRVNLNSISIHCLDYTRWEKVWQQANSSLSKIFEQSEPVQFKEIGLKYIDRFRYEGEEQKYDIRFLLDENTNYLTRKIFDSYARWHCHSGWYDEKSFEHRDVLNQLKINSGYTTGRENKSLIVTIDHTTLLRRTPDDDLSTFNPSPDGDTQFSRLMEHFHNNNKYILKQLLTKEISRKIQLT